MLFLTVTSCESIPKAPKFDIGLLQVKSLGNGTYSAKAHFTNQFGTEWTEGIEKLDKHYIFRGDQLIDLITWMDQIMYLMKRELAKPRK